MHGDVTHTHRYPVLDADDILLAGLRRTWFTTDSHQARRIGPASEYFDGAKHWGASRCDGPQSEGVYSKEGIIHQKYNVRWYCNKAVEGSTKFEW